MLPLTICESKVFLAVHLHMPNAQQRSWIHLALQRWLLACRRQWKIPSTISVAPDGSRFGCPAEDTIAYGFWHTESGTGGWLPIQAHMSKQHAFHCQW